MILLCGVPSEEPLARVAAAAAARGVEHVVLNQRLAAHVDVDLSVADGGATGALRLGARTVRLERLSGVYARLCDWEALPEAAPRRGAAAPSADAARGRFLHAVLLEWLELAACRVLNRPGAMGSNLSKPYQAQRIAAAGFRTPPTLVTSDPDAARAFRARHGRVIYKSTSAVRSIVQELDDAAARDLERVRGLPTQFQALIPGEDVRVHVVGARCFATRIRSTAVDYRYAARAGGAARLAPTELPPAVAARCRALSAALDLPFAGVDLRHTPDGEWYCLEVNPSPAYSYYEEHTGQPIAAAIVEHLAGA